MTGRGDDVAASAGDKAGNQQRCWSPSDRKRDPGRRAQRERGEPNLRHPLDTTAKRRLGCRERAPASRVVGGDGT